MNKLASILAAKFTYKIAKPSGPSTQDLPKGIKGLVYETNIIRETKVD